MAQLSLSKMPDHANLQRLGSWGHLWLQT